MYITLYYIKVLYITIYMNYSDNYSITEYISYYSILPLITVHNKVVHNNVVQKITDNTLH